MGCRTAAEPVVAGETECRPVKGVGKPDAGEPPVRFDGEELETGDMPWPWDWAPRGKTCSEQERHRPTARTAPAPYPTGRVQGRRQRWRNRERGHGERLLKPLAQAGGGSRVGLGQFRAESLKRGFSRNRALGVVGRTHRPLGDVPQLLRQPLPHVPDLVFLTALDDGLVEHIVHGAAELLRSVDHDQNRACDVQTAFTEAGQQFTHHGGVLRGALHDCQPVLDPRDVDPERHQAGLFAEMHAVHHQRDQVHLVQRVSEELCQRRRRLGDEATAERGLPRTDTAFLHLRTDRLQTGPVVPRGESRDHARRC